MRGNTIKNINNKSSIALGDHVTKRREGEMAEPCFSRLEAFFEDYFHRKKKVSGAHKGGA